MKSLICSDSHDHIRNLESALMVAKTSNCASVIFCGDFCSSFMLDVYHTHCELPLHGVFGNNDGDRFHLIKKATRLNKERKQDQQIHLHGEYLLAENGHLLDGIPSGIKLAVYHYPEMAQAIAASGKYNVVCFGHNHKSSIEKIGSTILMNPGSVMGYITGEKMQQVKPSCMIINWNTGEIELIEF